MTNSHWPAAFTCPQCHQEAGRAFKLASPRAGTISASVRCRECAHEWTLDRDTPTYAIRRKPDRRKAQVFKPSFSVN